MSLRSSSATEILLLFFVSIFDILINANPIVLKETDPLLFEKELLHKKLFVYDLIYNPKETKLLQMAKEQGATTSNGLGMLFYQGVLAFEHWAGHELMPAIREQMKMSLELGEII